MGLRRIYRSGENENSQIQWLKTARNEDDLGRLGDLVETVERAVENEIYYPIETPLNCSMCAFRQECREWRPQKRYSELTPELVELNGVGAC